VSAFNSFPEDVQRTLARPLFEQASEDHPEFAHRLTDRIPPEDITETTAEIMALFHPEPEVYAERIAALPPSKQSTDAQAAFVWHWTNRDPEAAVAWVESLPETSDRKTVASKLTGGWAIFDETAAVAWASGLADGPLRDGAALGLASAIASFDPDEALRWVTSISDSQTRIEAIVEAGRSQQEFPWNEVPEAFTAKIQALGLDSAEKTEGLRRLRDLESQSPRQ
jgi:hypothetical protein